MTTKQQASTDMSYLDFQAYVGITKHNGGFAATDELLALCHVAEAREVLYVGCGIGVGATYIARQHGCRVVGVDISEKMISWARLRAQEDKVEDQTAFRVADVLALPFEADRFDAVVVESVLAFVDDKPQALRECMRVTRSPEPAEGRTGGYVGLNESYWVTEPSPEMVAMVRASVGSAIPTAATWQALWEESGLHDRVVRLYKVNSRAEIRDRMRWVGWKWALRGFGRLFRLYLTQPAARQLLREMFATPSLDTLRLMGYGLFVGRK